MARKGHYASSPGYAWVTGANRGIGLQVALLLASQGKKIIAGVRSEAAGETAVVPARAARNRRAHTHAAHHVAPSPSAPAAGAETAAAVQKAVPGAVVEWVLVDQAKPDSIAAAVADLAKRFGRNVDVLVRGRAGALNV